MDTTLYSYSLAGMLTERDQEVLELKGKLFHGEANRRELHNRIQELRGNIRTVVRCPSLFCSSRALHLSIFRLRLWCKCYFHLSILIILVV